MARRLGPALAAIVLSAFAASAPARAQVPRPVLGLPIACQPGRDCEVQNYVDRDPGPGASDYRCQSNTYQGHNGVDIRLPDLTAMRRGVAVLAPAAGRVVRLRDGEPDRSVRDAPFAPGRDCGNAVAIDLGGGWEAMACHLKRGSLKVKVGDQVAAGQPIAQVGLSGNTEYPHVHLTVFRNRAVVDPFAPETTGRGACSAAQPLWSKAALGALGYKAGAILNAGFTNGPVALAAVDAGLPAAKLGGPAVVAYVRAINLRAGDQIVLEIAAPGGRTQRNAAAALPRNQAQYVSFAGLKGAAPGVYRARYQVLRAGKPVLERAFELKL
jgi:hypothetical protein